MDPKLCMFKKNNVDSLRGCSLTYVHIHVYDTTNSNNNNNITGQ